MKKEDAIKIISKSVKEYKNNLVNNNLLFIAGQPDKPIVLETVFLPRHFLRLTGVKLNGGNQKKQNKFYNKCLNGKLSPNDFYMASDGTTEMKLMVILPLMNIHITAKMMGDYNGTKNLLQTDKLIGSVCGCMEFVNENNYFKPNTLLNEDIRDVTYKPQNRVLAILRKPIKQEKYEELCYTAKGVQLDKIKLSSDYTEKIDILEFQKEKIQQQNQQPATNK